MRSPTTCVWRYAAFAFLFLAAVCQAQVVINAPPTVIGINFNVNAGETLNVGPGGEVGAHLAVRSGGVVNVFGGRVGTSLVAYSDSEVNIAGGRVGNSATAGPNSVVTISGGWVDTFFRANSGSEVNITGGTVWTSFEAQAGSTVNLSGGTVGSGFRAFLGSDVELIGGEYRLNGAALGDSSVLLGPADVLTGTLADGSTFVFTALGSDGLEENLTLTQAPLPTLDLVPRVIDSVVADGPSGLRAGQTLSVVTGGALRENFAVVNATLNVEGGTVARGVEVADGVVNVSGGEVGLHELGASSYAILALMNSELNISGGVVGNVRAHAGSVVHVSGGRLSYGATAHAGSVVNVTGGDIAYIAGGKITARSGSEVNLSGGTVGQYFDSQPGSVVNISGGAVGRAIAAREGSNVELYGSDFRVNGVEYLGDNFTLGPNDLFTGTLADGSTFIFTRLAGDSLQGVTLNRTTLPPLDLTPIVVESPLLDGPMGLRADQELTVRPGGELRDFFAVVDATLNIEGGSVGQGVEIARGQMNLSGGTVGDELSAFTGSVVNISGGTVGYGFQAFAGSVVNMTGGTVDMEFRALSGSVVNLSGGTVGHGFDAFAGSEVNLLGREFFINGAPLSQLQPGQAFSVLNRNVTLSGKLADGTDFSFVLITDSFTQEFDYFFSRGASLTVTLVVPEPSSCALTAVLGLGCCPHLRKVRRARGPHGPA